MFKKIWKTVTKPIKKVINKVAKALGPKGMKALAIASTLFTLGSMAGFWGGAAGSGAASAAGRGRHLVQDPAELTHHPLLARHRGHRAGQGPAEARYPAQPIPRGCPRLQTGSVGSRRYRSVLTWRSLQRRVGQLINTDLGHWRSLHEPDRYRQGAPVI